MHLIKTRAITVTDGLETNSDDTRIPENFPKQRHVPENPNLRRRSFWGFRKLNIWTDRRVIMSYTHGFPYKSRQFSRDSLQTTAMEEKKHCASPVVPSGTCSPPPRQQLINRPGSSPETTETHRTASLSLRTAFRADYLFFVYRWKE